MINLNCSAFDLGTSPHGLSAGLLRTVQTMCAVVTNLLFLKADIRKVTSAKVPPFANMKRAVIVRLHVYQPKFCRSVQVLYRAKVLRCTKKAFDVKSRQLSLKSLIIALTFSISTTAQSATFNSAGLPIPQPVQVGPSVRTGTLMMYNTPQTGPVYENAFSSNFPPMVGYPNVNVSPNPRVTPTNAAGYEPSMATGSPTLRTEVPVSVTPPPGAPVSGNVSAAAVSMAGAGMATGVLVNDIPLGSGVGSLAFNLALAGGGLALSVASANPFGMALAGAAAGQAGYALYQALNAQGLQVNPSGNLYDTSVAGAAGVQGVAGTAGVPAHTVTGPAMSYGGQNFATVDELKQGACDIYLGAFGPCGLDQLSLWTVNGIGGASGQVIRLSTVKGTWTSVASATYTVPAVAPIAAIPPVPAIPPTQAKLETSLVNALQSNTVALDAAALAIKNGVNIATIVSQTNAPSTVGGLDLASPFSEVTQTTDALGNTTSTVQRTRVKLAPSAPGGQSIPDVRTETVVVNNGTPTNTTATPVQASLLPGLVGGALGGLAGSLLPNGSPGVDFCIANPDALACSNDANVGDVPEVPLEQKTVDVSSFTPFALNKSAICPAPIAIGSGKFFTFGGICEWLTMLNPVIKAFAYLGAGFLIFRSRPYA